MIPKVIHYCWFGGNPLPPLAEKCIKSWKRYCPDYEIKEWNEKSFDMSCNLYVKQAYEAKKYAFVSDYVRLYVLYTIGGVYMDTDVEVLKSIDMFLTNEAFSGFEDFKGVSTAIMGCICQHSFFETLLLYYSEHNFIRNDGSYDLTTNVQIITAYCVQNGLRLNNRKQTVNGFTLYPQKYFCPKDYATGEINLTPDTYTIHHFSGSWVPKSEKVKRRLIRILGPRLTKTLLFSKKKIGLIFRR